MENLADVSLTIEYVMGRTGCLRLGQKSALALSIMQAYGNYFIACKEAEKVLNDTLRKILEEVKE